MSQNSQDQSRFSEVNNVPAREKVPIGIVSIVTDKNKHIARHMGKYKSCPD
jgi:hypothetical protein